MTSQDVLLSVPPVLVAVMTAALTPLALRVAQVPRRLWLASYPAGLLAGAALLPEPGVVAVALTLPYVAVAVAAGLIGAKRLLRWPTTACDVAGGVGLIFIGGATTWLVANRADYALLDYPPFWTLLTSAHFHVAGAYLMLLVAHVGRSRGRFGAAVAIGVVGGVPLTAAGIYGPHWLEQAAGLVMAAAGLGAGAMFVTSRERVPVRVAGGVLLATMPLAAGYAAREHGTAIAFGGLDALSSMLLAHGAANTLAFALPALLGIVRDLDPA